MKTSRNRIFPSLACVLFLGFCSIPVAAQQDTTVEWKLSLDNLEQRLSGLPSEGPSVNAWRADAEALRGSIASFGDSHREISMQIPDALAARPSREDLEQRLKTLRTLVDDVIKQSPNTPFNLGVVEVSVTAPATPPSPVSDSLSKVDMDNRDFVRVSQAFDYLPGVQIQHLSGTRNEAGVMVRGFSTRGQVPFYLDGIPISIPYDGYVDFSRFLTGDLAQIQASKGYSSPLLGPNALGGTINLVTREPANKLEGEGLIGTAPGSTLLASLRLGSRSRRFFVQGSFDWLETDFIPLPGDYPVVQYTALPHIVMTDHFNNSESRDQKFSGRLGWTPRGADEYVFSVIDQKGKKQVPLYQGPNTAATFRQFWSWPFWNMNSYYFHSTTALGDMSAVKVQAYYNRYRNQINMYSDDTYSSFVTTNAEHSFYDEHADGAAVQYTTRMIPRNDLGMSVYFKDDTHKEWGIYPFRGLTTLTLTDRAQTASIGFQDRITVSERVNATVGFTADHLKGLQAQSNNTTLTALVPFICTASPTNTSFSGCTPHIWNFNPQVAFSYAVSDSGNFFVTFANRARFPTLKEIYTSAAGAGLPNPDIQPERSRNWNVGYSTTLSGKTLVQLALFRSDVNNAIESVNVTDPGGTDPATAFCRNSKIVGYCAEIANIGKEMHDGVELTVRTRPTAALTAEVSYSYLNRTITYDFAKIPIVSQVNTSLTILPTLPKNKVVATATVRMPHDVVGIVGVRYEAGLLLQDSTYAATSPSFLPFTESFTTMDLAASVGFWKRATIQAGVKNLFDKTYYYTAGYPEIGRNWYFNVRCPF